MTIVNTMAGIDDNMVFLCISYGVILLLLGIAVLMIIIVRMIQTKSFTLIAPLVFLIMMEIGFSCMIYTSVKDSQKIHYQVLLDQPTIDSEEFNQNYKIVSRSGAVYTIVER